MLQRGPFHWGITCGLFHDVIVACITLQRQVASPARNQRKHAEIAGDVASLAGSHHTHAEVGCRDIDGYGASLESPPSRAVRPQAPAGRKGLGGQDASRTECISRTERISSPAAHVRFATDNLRAAAPVEAGAGGGCLPRDAQRHAQHVPRDLPVVTLIGVHVRHLACA